MKFALRENARSIGPSKGMSARKMCCAPDDRGGFDIECSGEQCAFSKLDLEKSRSFTSRLYASTKGGKMATFKDLKRSDWPA